MKLDTRLAFRLPATVADSWRDLAKSENVSLSDFVRSAVDQKQVSGFATPGATARKRRSYSPINPALIREVAKIGNNLNQLSRFANTQKTGVDAVELLLELRSIRLACESLIEGGTDAD